MMMRNQIHRYGSRRISPAFPPDAAVGGPGSVRLRNQVHVLHRAPDEDSVEVFVARQPILDSNLKVFGHELLHRSGAANFYSGTEPSLASLEVINNSLFSVDIAQMVAGTRAFINFGRDLLVSEAAHVLPPNDVVIEVLEDTAIDAEVLAACRKLRARGYLLAADDIVTADQLQPLLDVVDFIKVDFQAASAAETKRIVGMCGRRYTCLAEKVETQAEFASARQMGYQLFQGYFFARPTVMTGRQIPGYKMNYLRILQAVHRPRLEFTELERLIQQEVSVTYKLLHYANSALFGQRRQIESIRRALVILGEQELRKWTSVVLLIHLAVDSPDALILCALTRASFCESLARLACLGARKSELFLMGLFSLLDAITGAPLEKALGEIRLAGDIHATLLGHPSASPAIGSIFALVKAYERGEWGAVVEFARRLRVDGDEVRDAYLQAVTWCQQVFSTPQVTGAPAVENAPQVPAASGSLAANACPGVAGTPSAEATGRDPCSRHVRNR